MRIKEFLIFWVLCFTSCLWQDTLWFDETDQRVHSNEEITELWVEVYDERGKMSYVGTWLTKGGVLKKFPLSDWRLYFTEKIGVDSSAIFPENSCVSITKSSVNYDAPVCLRLYMDSLEPVGKFNLVKREPVFTFE